MITLNNYDFSEDVYQRLITLPDKKHKFKTKITLHRKKQCAAIFIKLHYILADVLKNVKKYDAGDVDN